MLPRDVLRAERRSASRILQFMRKETLDEDLRKLSLRFRKLKFNFHVQLMHQQWGEEAKN